MGLVVLLIGLGLLVTGALMVKAGKARTDAAALVGAGRVGLGLGSVVATVGLCWVVVAGF